MRHFLLLAGLTSVLAVPHKRQEESSITAPPAETISETAPTQTLAVEDMPHPDTDWKCVRTCEERGAYVIMRSYKNKIQCSGPDNNGCSWFHNPSCDGQIPLDKDAPTYDIGYSCLSYNMDWCGEGLRQFWKAEPQSVCELDKIAPENLSNEEKALLNGETFEDAPIETSTDEGQAAASDGEWEFIPPSDVNHGAPTNMALYFPGAADAADSSNDWLTQTHADGTYDEAYEDSAPGQVNAAAYEA